MLLHKPVDPMRLRAVLHQILRAHELGETAATPLKERL